MRRDERHVQRRLPGESSAADRVSGSEGVHVSQVALLPVHGRRAGRSCAEMRQFAGVGESVVFAALSQFGGAASSGGFGTSSTVRGRGAVFASLGASQIAQRSPISRLVHEQLVRQLQQAVPHVAAQLATAAPRQPGVFGGAPVAARMVPQRLRLLSEMPGRTRQGTETEREERLELSLFFAQVRVRSCPIFKQSLILLGSSKAEVPDFSGMMDKEIKVCVYSLDLSIKKCNFLSQFCSALAV